jgi:hypothetical protein
MTSKTLKATLTLSILLTGCSGLFSPSAPTSQQPQTELEAPVRAKKTQGVEVTWEMPGDPVDGFIIRYGANPALLSREITVFIRDIQEENDPEFGPVYRYLIKDIEGAKRVYVSIAAIKGKEVSNFSPALEARAE